MLFESVDFSHEERVDRFPRVTLRRDRRWNDHGYRCRYTLTFHDEQGRAHEVGEVKILQRHKKWTDLPSEFHELGADFVSLGQSAAYYRQLDELGGLGEQILVVLRDLSHSSMKDVDLGDYGEGVEVALLRFPQARRVFDERAGHRLDVGLSFTYRYRFRHSFDNEHVIDFRFDPRTRLGRINVLVGENASGKTAVLGRLAFALSGTEAEGELSEPGPKLSPILAVSFSAFDHFRRPDFSDPLYEYIGLRKFEPAGRRTDDEPLDIKLDVKAAFELLDVRAREIRDRDRVEEWRNALAACGLDSRLTEADHVSAEMKRLSSGQKFAVFVLTNLVAKLEARSMVLFDEPELHTHPRMLTGMMRALTDLLHAHDSFAIVATHSPIVLQEVPAKSIRIFERFEGHAIVQEYPGESYGALLDQIVREAFRVTRSERNFIHYVEDMDEDAYDALGSMLSDDLSLTTRALLDKYRRDKG